MEISKENIFYIVLIIFIIAVTTWSILIKISVMDPEIELKYDDAGKELVKLKPVVIEYYCTKGKFPDAMEDLVPEFIPQLPVDPWGSKYILKSLAWRRVGTGVDLASKGSDRKQGGKSWDRDVIIRIDREKIRCKDGGEGARQGPGTK